MSEQPYKWMNFKDEKIILSIKVIPNSSKNLIQLEDEFLKVKLKAPPVDNKANSELIEFLSKELKIPKSSITLISGQTSKNKRLSIPIEIKDKFFALINS